MDCAAEGGGSTSAVSAMNVDEESAVRATPDDEQGGAICDCQSCLAPAPAAIAVALASPPAPDVPIIRFAAPHSIERAPLVPPPQAVA